MSSDDRPDDTVVVMSAASRSLRRALRPLAWVILEDVALDAVPRTAGWWPAPRPARSPSDSESTRGPLPEHCASCVSAGFLVLEREKGPAGRFGLSVYVIGTIPGLTVISPSADRPCTVSSFVVSPLAVLPSAVYPRMDGPHMCPPNKDFSSMGYTAEPEPNRIQTSRTSLSNSVPQCTGQTTLDLDEGIA